MKTFLSTILFLVSFAPLANAGDFFRWFSDGDCHEVSGGGADRGYVSDASCGGTVYKWDAYGNCHQVTLGGADRGYVIDASCGGAVYKQYSDARRSRWWNRK